jgi:hypothetical protein
MDPGSTTADVSCCGGFATQPLSEDNVTVEGSEPEATVPEIDTSKPHPARMYDYYLGGCSLNS